MAIVSFFKSQELDIYGYSIFGVIFFGFYIILQWFFLWRLKSAGRRHWMPGVIFQVGLLMLFISQIFLIIFNWPLTSVAGYTFEQAILKSQLALSGVMALMGIVAGLYWRLRRKSGLNRRDFRVSPVKSLAAACAGLAIIGLLVGAVTGFYDKPRPFTSPMRTIHMGQLTLSVPSDWPITTWVTKVALPGLPYCEMTETLFINPDKGDEEFEKYLKSEQQPYFKRAERQGGEASLDWEDVSHIFNRPAVILALPNTGSRGPIRDISFILVLRYEQGYVALQSDWRSEPTDFNRRNPGYFSYSIHGQNRARQKEAGLSEHKSQCAVSVCN